MSLPKYTHQNSPFASADAARAEVIRTRDTFNDALAAIGLDQFVANELVGGR
jgi:hypothetical protein